MFDGLLKSKFYTKCKSATKLTKTRIELIKRKRNAMQKFLKNDIADLLKNDLDVNAYGRAEGLLVEMNLTTCYDIAERFCVNILNNLGVMSKQRECPEECREAVSSLMFAAARFADLPELRELRNIFTARFGNSLDCYANKEFVEKLKATHPTKEMKLQLIQDIASEAGLDWNRKAAEEKLYKPPVFKQAKISAIEDVDEFQTHENTADIAGVQNDRGTYRECTSPDIEREDVKHEDDNPSNQTQYSEERIPFKDIDVDNTGKNIQETEPKATRDVPDEAELDDKKPFYYKFVPPPYTKAKAANIRYKDEGQENAELDEFREREDKQWPDDRVRDSKPKPISVRRRRTKPELADDDESRATVSSGQTETEQAPDEEERMMDKLLMHYSRKKSSCGETGQVPQPKEPEKVTRRGSWDVPPKRAPSPPVGQASSTETNRRHARSSSLQPDMSKGPAHPKLPDYDDFVARLATLREGKQTTGKC